MTDVAAMTDDDVVRWHECLRRTAYDTHTEAILATSKTRASGYRCVWTPDHFHAGVLPTRRGPARRISNAWGQYARHLAAAGDLTQATAAAFRATDVQYAEALQRLAEGITT